MQAKHWNWRKTAALLVVVTLPLATAMNVLAADPSIFTAPLPGIPKPKPLSAVLPPDQWKKLESAVDRALAWMATQQERDGSFPTVDQGEPAVTSLCVMAFLSRGHQPGAGPYGAQINRAIDFVLGCQKPDGLLCKQVPGASYQLRQASQTATYNHGIAGLMLGEVYGQVTGDRARKTKTAIEKAIVYTRTLQLRPRPASEQGGWRYVVPYTYDADVSVTAWQLMFLRSARNAEFPVPQQYVDEGMEFVQRCFSSGNGQFGYTLSGGEASRGTTSAGIVALSMGGLHQSPMALKAGDWLLANPYRNYGDIIGEHDKYIYSAFYSSQAAAQLGGRYWEGIFPPLVRTLLDGQQRNGSWRSEADLAMFGDVMTTAFAVLALTPPYQYLPVYQR